MKKIEVGLEFKGINRRSMKENTIQKLTDREHILLRPNMYAGAVEETERELLIYEDGKFIYKNVKYIPALIKIIEEIIDNAVDEAIRTDFQYANTIKVKYKDGYFTVEDNGRGVPQELDENGIPQTVIAFTEAKSGSNFSEETKANGIGTNGVGSYICNVFCESFKVETWNGESKLTLDCQNNTMFIDYKSNKSTNKPGTKIEFKPDLNYFKVSDYTDDYFAIIKNRLYHLAQSFPQISFHVNF